MEEECLVLLKLAELCERTDSGEGKARSLGVWNKRSLTLELQHILQTNQSEGSTPSSEYPLKTILGDRYIKYPTNAQFV